MLAAESVECLNNFSSGGDHCVNFVRLISSTNELSSTQFLRRAHVFLSIRRPWRRDMMLTSKALYGILLALPMAYSWFGCPHSTYSNRLVVFESMP